MRGAALALLLLAPGYAQKVDTGLRAAVRDPMAFARYVETRSGFSWDDVTRALGVAPISARECGGEFSECTAELVTILDPEQTIVRVHGAGPSEYYFRYRKEPRGAWRFSGVYEAFSHNFSPYHQVERELGKPYLRVHVQGVRGSDIGSEVKCWFDLTAAVFDPVFCFPVRGHEGRFVGISREFESSVRTEGDAFRVDVFMRFFGSSYERLLGETRLTARYRPQPGKQASRFLDAARTENGVQAGRLSQKEFEGLLELDQGPGNEALIPYGMRGLLEIAEGGNADAREWLGELLKASKATAETQELRKLLKR